MAATARVQVVTDTEIGVRLSTDQAVSESDEYRWDVYDVATSEAFDFVYIGSATDEEAALEEAVKSARDNFREDTKHGPGF